MAEVEFSNAAVADLADIDEFSVAQFGDEVAEVYMHGFDGAFALLRDFPLRAPLCSDLGTGLRCLKHRQHHILYSGNADKVLILRVVHHAMDARHALKDEAR